MRISYYIPAILTCFFLIFGFPNLNAQVGIGTVNPDSSAMLDINANNQGVILPQVALINSTDVTTIINPGLALLVFNTANINDISEGYRYWNGTRWVPFVIDDIQTVRCTNTDYIGGGVGNKTNLYVLGGLKAPLFGSLEWNDSSSLFSVDAAARELTVSKAGTYRIEFSLYFVAPAADYALAAQLHVNGSPVGPTAASGFINGPNFGLADSEHAHISLSTVISLSTNDVLSVFVNKDTSNVGSVYLSSVGSSTITVSRLK